MQPRPQIQNRPEPATSGVLVKVLAVLVLAVFSVVLGAAFALPGKKKVTDASKANDAPSAPIHAPVPAEPTDEAPARPAAPPTAFDTPGVKPALPDGPAGALVRRINADVTAKLREANLAASPVSGDAEFVRRAHLDLIGRIPGRDRVVAFLDDADPHKRSKLIDELLASPDFGRHQARLWADLLIKRDFDNNKNLRPQAFIAWLAERINNGAGWDRIATEMITASGPEGTVAPTFFVLANLDNRQPSPSKLTGSVGNLFMGVQIQCAECHQHPTTAKWGMNDFWGVAAFFGHTRAQRDGGPKDKKMLGPATIQEVDGGKAAKGKNKAAAVPAGLAIAIPDPNDPRKVVRTAKGKFFLGDKPPPAGAAPYRPHLAAWLTAKDNPYFAKATVNRLWAHFFARGLVNPIDDMHPENKATHPELLAALAAAFVEAKFDIKHLARAVCNSEAYQATSRPTDENREDEKLYSHMPVKVMDAAALLDSLAVATGVRGARRAETGKAAERSPTGVGGDPQVRFFDTREADDDAAEFSYGIPQILRLMNTRLTSSSAAVAADVHARHKDDPAKAIEELFLLALARRPTPRELSRMTAHVGKSEDVARGYAGVMWALLNSAEFVSNH